jgi:hypothetical protein
MGHGGCTGPGGDLDRASGGTVIDRLPRRGAGSQEDCSRGAHMVIGSLLIS